MPRNPARAVGLVAQVQRRLQSRQLPAAIEHFRKNVQVEGLSQLEGCVSRIGSVKGKESKQAMLRSFRLLVNQGYSPSSKLWTQLVKTAPVSIVEFDSLTSKAGTAWVKDEMAVVALMQFYGRKCQPAAVEAIFEVYQEALQEEGQNNLPGVDVWTALIEAMNAVQDPKGALKWFDIWRRSRAHPLGHFEQEVIVGKGRESRPTPSDFSSLPLYLSGRLQPRSSLGSRLAHTLPVLPSSPPQPYISLLRGLLNSNYKRTKVPLELVELMAADRVALDTAVYNGLMQHELVKDEAQSNASILSLYSRMTLETNPSARPDQATFRLVLQSYKEPRWDVGKPFAGSLPTRLARAAELPPPPQEALAKPRTVIRDMLRSLGYPVITPRLIEHALLASIKTRDLAGAAVVLDLFTRYGFIYTARVHAIIVMGTLRAYKRREAFLHPASNAWFAEHQEMLLGRVQSVNELSEWLPEPAVASRSLSKHKAARHTESPSARAAYRRIVAGTFEPADTWNGRNSRRKEWEIRATKRIELGDVQFLHQLLLKASSLSEQGWEQHKAAARQDMGVS